jgi:hypothetical protein
VETQCAADYCQTQSDPLRETHCSAVSHPDCLPFGTANCAANAETDRDSLEGSDFRRHNCVI